jgi:hypothetical protein
MFVFSSLDQLQQKSKEISQFVNKPNLQKNETASQTSLPDVNNEGDQVINVNFSVIYMYLLC